MTATSTLAPPMTYPDVDLTDDRPSAREFWATTLTFAVVENATSVRYRQLLGDDCLSLIIDGTDWALDPPPDEYRAWLYRVGEEIIAGRGLRGLLKPIWGRYFQRPISGSVTLIGEANREVWSASCFPRDKQLVWQRVGLSGNAED